MQHLLSSSAKAPDLAGAQLPQKATRCICCTPLAQYRFSVVHKANPIAMMHCFAKLHMAVVPKFVFLLSMAIREQRYSKPGFRHFAIREASLAVCRTVLQL